MVSDLEVSSFLSVILPSARMRQTVASKNHWAALCCFPAQLYMCMYAFVYVYVCICIYIYMYIYIRIYRISQSQSQSHSWSLNHDLNLSYTLRSTSRHAQQALFSQTKRLVHVNNRGHNDRKNSTHHTWYANIYTRLFTCTKRFINDRKNSTHHTETVLRSGTGSWVLGG